MPTYNAKCPNCGHEQEYFCKMSEREKKEALPLCENRIVIILANGIPETAPCLTKMENAFTSNNQGNFILKGGGWFKTGGY